MKLFSVLFLLSVPCWGQLMKQNLDWSKKLPSFAFGKPVQRTRDLLISEQGKLWLGIGFVLSENGPKFTGLAPIIAGTNSSWDDERIYTHVAEYITLNGKSIWILMRESRSICTGLVPSSEPPSAIKIFSKNGDLVAKFTPGPAAEIPSWHPRLDSLGNVVFSQTSGDFDAWKENRTIAAYARLSLDNGKTWTNFEIIFPPDPKIALPKDEGGKNSVLIEVFSRHGLRFKMNRFELPLIHEANSSQIN